MTETTEQGRSEEATLEEHLLQLEQELQAHYYHMGKCMLDLADLEQRKINQLVDSMIETRKELAALRAEKICQNCATINDADSIYCKRCGEQLEEE